MYEEFKEQREMKGLEFKLQTRAQSEGKSIRGRGDAL
jgi:hypothetical protein